MIDDELKRKDFGFHSTGEGGRIIIAGGGTGGHIFPAIAIAHALEKMLRVQRYCLLEQRGKWKWKKCHRQDLL